MQTPTPENIDRALPIVGADQAVADAEGLAQVHPPGFLGEEGIRTRLDDEVTGVLRQDHPAQSLLGLD
jgi:hypothetical protein